MNKFSIVCKQLTINCPGFVPLYTQTLNLTGLSFAFSGYNTFILKRSDLFDKLNQTGAQAPQNYFNYLCGADCDFHNQLSEN